jgi:vacuolar protein sorting-associated protein 13A/C
VQGVGKGLVGAVAAPVSGGLDMFSSAMEGLDASKDSLLGRPRAGNTLDRRRLPRTIGGDFKLLPFIREDSAQGTSERAVNVLSNE